MRSMRFSLPILAALAIAFSLTTTTQAQTFTTLASIDRSGVEGLGPNGLVQGLDGNFYGTMALGGSHAFAGNIFKLTPQGQISTLYRFCGQLSCPQQPEAGLVLGTDGNFFGTTSNGGTPYLGGSGTIFEVTPEGEVGTLYTFCAQNQCSAYPVLAGQLVQSSIGNFYGTTQLGGASNNGSAFAITPTGAFSTIYSFCAPNCDAGALPNSPLVEGLDGTLYGTASVGPIAGGAVFKITTAGQVTVLYRFCLKKNCADGDTPYAGLALGSDANFYGTTSYGGVHNLGTVFKITPAGLFTTLHSFDGNDGEYPGALVQASDGNLYGTSSLGGIGGGGTIYRISEAGEFTTLYQFCTPSVCASSSPSPNLTQATNGDFYGATGGGGAYGAGTFFSFSVGLAPFVKTVPIAGKVGTRVIILGNNLTGSTSVTFNGTAASFTVVSDTEITATVPTGATTGTLAVTTPSGTLKSNRAFQVVK